jgi:site-specific DNA recombinase
MKGLIMTTHNFAQNPSLAENDDQPNPPNADAIAPTTSTLGRLSQDRITTVRGVSNDNRPEVYPRIAAPAPELLQTRRRKAVGYVRYSREGENEPSIARQTETITNMAIRMDVDLIRIFRDDGISGATLFGRPSLVALMETIESKQFDIILAEDWDRISREAADSHYFYKKADTNRIEIHTSTTGLVNRITVAFKGVASEEIRHSIAQRTAKGRDSALREGRVSHRCPFGLRLKQGGKRGQLERHPEYSLAVEQIYKQFLGGASIANIARQLTGKVPTPQEASRIVSDRMAPDGSQMQWNTNMVRQLLRNPKYFGLIVDRTTAAERDPVTNRQIRRKLRPSEEWKAIRLPHLAIVTEETFNACGDLLDKNIHSRNQKNAPSWKKHLLMGKVYCSCGAEAKIRVARRKKFFACPAPDCIGFDKVALEIVESAVLDVLQTSLDSDKTENARYNAALISHRDEIDGMFGENIKNLTATAEVTQRRIDLARARDPALQGPDEIVKLESDCQSLALLINKIADLQIELQNRKALSPGSLKEGFTLMRRQLPFRSDTQAGSVLTQAVREIITKIKVEVRKIDRLPILSITIDLGASGDGRAWHKTVEHSFDPAADGDLAQSKKTAEHAALYKIKGGDIPESIWTSIYSMIDYVEASIRVFGLELLQLVNACRFQLATNCALGDLPIRFGNSTTFTAATAALVRSGALDEVAKVLNGTAWELPRPDLLVPHVNRPHDADVRRRKSLAPKEQDAEWVAVRKQAVAYHLDGFNYDLAGKHVGLPRRLVRDLCLVFEIEGVTALERRLRYELAEDVSGNSPEALRAAASCVICPDLELRLVAVADFLESRNMIAAAAAIGRTPKWFKRQIEAYNQGGLLALISGGWRLRQLAIVPGPHARHAAAEIRRCVAHLPAVLAVPAIAIAMHFEGSSASHIMAVTGLDAMTVNAALERYRLLGVDGLVPAKTVMSEIAELRRQALKAETRAHAARYNLIADHLEGLDIASLAKAYLIDEIAVTRHIRVYRRVGRVTVRRYVHRITEQELAKLREIIATNVNPDDPRQPLNYGILEAYCAREFGVVLTRACLYQHGLRIGPQNRIRSDKAVRNQVAARIAQMQEAKNVQ